MVHRNGVLAAHSGCSPHGGAHRFSAGSGGLQEAWSVCPQAEGLDAQARPAVAPEKRRRRRRKRARQPRVATHGSGIDMDRREWILPLVGGVAVGVALIGLALLLVGG